MIVHSIACSNVTFCRGLPTTHSSLTHPHLFTHIVKNLHSSHWITFQLEFVPSLSSAVGGRVFPVHILVTWPFLVFISHGRINARIHKAYQWTAPCRCNFKYAFFHRMQLFVLEELLRSLGAATCKRRTLWTKWEARWLNVKTHCICIVQRSALNPTPFSLPGCCAVNWNREQCIRAKESRKQEKQTKPGQSSAGAVVFVLCWNNEHVARPRIRD